MYNLRIQFGTLDKQKQNVNAHS